MYWRFIHLSFSVSKMAPWATTRSSVNRSDELPLAVDLAGVVGGRPAEQGHEVEERLGEEAGLLVLHDAGGAVALAHLGTVGAEDHGDVGELRQRRAQRPVDQDLLRRVGDVVLAADDVVIAIPTSSTTTAKL